MNLNSRDLIISLDQTEEFFYNNKMLANQWKYFTSYGVFPETLVTTPKHISVKAQQMWKVETKANIEQISHDLQYPGSHILLAAVDICALTICI